MTRRILVVAAHPDDEILGFGGTVAKHADAGDDVHVVILAEGATSRSPSRDRQREDEEIGRLRAASNAAAAVLGTRPPLFFDFPDNRMDGVEGLDVTKAVEGVIGDVRPSRVYTHFAGDLNVDHRIVARAVATACRPLPGCEIESVLAGETVSSTEWSMPQDGVFQPTVYVDVSGQLERKLEALRCYHAEMRPFPHARSIEAVEALARLRGAQAGMAAAEAFSLIRRLWR